MFAAQLGTASGSRSTGPTFITEVAERYQIERPDVRVTKLGSKLYVEVDALVQPDVTVTQEQAVRTAVRDGLEVLPYEIWLNLELAPRPDPTGREPVTDSSDDLGRGPDILGTLVPKPDRTPRSQRPRRSP